MSATHSSSALVVNVLEPWRASNQLEILGRCLGYEDSYSSLGFEAGYAVGVRGATANLDVELRGGNVPLAIESKFREPYEKSNKQPFQPSYFSTDAAWDGVTLGHGRPGERSIEKVRPVPLNEILDGTLRN